MCCAYIFINNFKDILEGFEGIEAISYYDY